MGRAAETGERTQNAAEEAQSEGGYMCWICLRIVINRRTMK
jgi:hypothetical protein